MSRHYMKPPKQKLHPVSTRRGLRLHAWVFAGVIACACVTVFFFPALMALTAAQEDEAGWMADASLFVLILPGLFTAVLYILPVWFILRLWLGRQPEDSVTGPKPATVPVFLTIWVGYTGLQRYILGDATPTPPLPPFDILPDPASAFFNGVILVKMAGIAVMFLFYRQARPADP